MQGLFVFSQFLKEFYFYYFLCMIFQFLELLIFSVDVGKLIYYFQNERDLSILFMSVLGFDIRFFLFYEYLVIDSFIESLDMWLGNLDCFD